MEIENRKDNSFFFRGIRFLGGFVFFLVIFIIGIFLNLYPYYPKTLIGWVLLIVFGIPIYLAGEWFYGKLYSQKISDKISKKKFSLARIFIALVITLASLSIFYLAYFLFLKFGF
jgi:hypothetical protein